MSMSFLRGAIAAAALAGAAASADAATTYSFTGAGPDVASISGPNFTITPADGGLLNVASAYISQNATGLGVGQGLDTEPGQIDGSPILSGESLVVTFAWAVKLVSVTLSAIDGGDDLTLFVDGSFYSTYGPGLSNPATIMVGQNLTSFAVAAIGVPLIDGLLPSSVLRDNFRLQSFTVAPVPLPAGGLLLGAALAGAGLIARRRKAA